LTASATNHVLIHRYLDKVDAAVKAAKQATEGPITLLARSAGGWLARVYLLVWVDMGEIPS
jgi:alpha-beta hydrolase superfamily lysophospholipase